MGQPGETVCKCWMAEKETLGILKIILYTVHIWIEIKSSAMETVRYPIDPWDYGFP